ncbi:excisionase family DNA binding protein [Paenibacillus mucilaginosus]|uniref:helix-turn-helix domain-containing protein n=1 Tax=Paenibacillus mucilaginosus TaxID=61624 RepID=UPI003D1E1EA0
MSTYLDVTSAAKEIGITVVSLYKLINHQDPTKRLEPVNRNTYRGDGGYRFTSDDVQRIKGLYTKVDLTISETAKELGRSNTFVYRLIREGQLEAYEAEFKGKRVYFITRENLDRFKLQHPDTGASETIYDRKNKLFLFQPFMKDGRLARIVEMKRVSVKRTDSLLQIGHDERIPYAEAIEQGWRPLYSIPDHKPLHSYGFARFVFPKPTTLDSVIYNVIEEMFRHIGPVNMKIHQDAGSIIVEVKKAVLTNVLPSTHPDLIDKLKLFIKSGEIVIKYDGVLIDTGFSPVTFYLPEKKKEALQQLAQRSGMTLQEWLDSVVSQAAAEEAPVAAGTL